MGDKTSLALTNYQFADQSGFIGQSAIGIEFDSVTLETTEYDNFGKEANTGKVQWTTGDNTVNGGNFIDSKLTEQSRHVLSIQPTTSSGIRQEVMVDSYYSWQASNVVAQEVGSGSRGNRQGVGTAEMFFVVPLDSASPGFLAALARRETLNQLTLSTYNSKDQKVREWTLDKVIPTSFSTSSQGDSFSAQQELVVAFNVGRIESAFIDPNAEAEQLGSGSLHVSRSSGGAEATVASAFLDFITPPTSNGIPDILASQISPARTIKLSDFFLDEQEASTDLTYSFNIDSNPGLFTSAVLNGDELTLDFSDVLTGTATLSVTATDTFALENTQSFDVDLEFGLDFGDAPAPYPTTIADAGAHHFTNGPTLGTGRDRESDGQPTTGADGDDLDTGDDEDGVEFGVINVANALAGVNISLGNASSGRVDAWLDFNADGDWDDPGEQILASVNVDQPLQTLNFSIPTGSVPIVTYARVRISSAGGLSPTGPAVDGEVEDHQVEITAAPTVDAFSVNGGDSQRSNLTELSLTFDSEVTAPASAFQVKQRGSGIVLDSLVVNSTLNAQGKTVSTLTFGDNGNLVVNRTSGGNTLVDGNYELTIDHTQIVKVAGGPAMASDYVLGDDAADKFFRFFGDHDGDRDTDTADLPVFGATFRKNSGDAGFDNAFDFEGDNDVDAGDLIQFGQRFRQSLPFS